jgi:hypothetical protein
MKELVIACPLLSLMKASPVQCRASGCAWWVKLPGLPDDCALVVVANFFAERSFKPAA